MAHMISDNYVHKTPLDWKDPLFYAASIDEQYNEYVFLHSSKLNEKNRFSILGFGVKRKFCTLRELADHLSDGNSSLFGHIGYELNNQLENPNPSEPSWINTDDVCFFEFNNIIVFDHENKTAELMQIDPEKCKFSSTSRSLDDIPTATAVYSNMTQDYYIESIAKTVQTITDGRFCQANITRSFFGEAAKKYDPFAVFHEACLLNPAPYSSIIKTNTYSLVSSSPEMFLTIDDNNVSCSLIKGSAPRYLDQEKDMLSAAELSNSQKNIAENLMVIDLMRNDMAKNSVPGSVKVPNMFELKSYEGIHHLVSTVTSTKISSCSTLKFICDCFPPGSVTGTPKLECIKWCAEIEKTRRNAYCGAIGILGNNFAKLSVVIRTIMLYENKFEFHAGGGITCLSDPHQEHEEVMIKINRMAKCVKADTLAYKLTN